MSMIDYWHDWHVYDFMPLEPFKCYTIGPQSPLTSTGRCHWKDCETGCLLFCNVGTFEATDTAHCSKHGGLHFNIPHSGLVRFSQILQLLLRREGAEGPVQPALTCTDTEQGSSATSWSTVIAVSQTTNKDERTFVEVVGAHGVSDDGRQVLQLRGALQELVGHSLVQLGAPGDDFTQNHLFKLGAEGVIHRFVCDHHCPWRQTYRRKNTTLVQINHTHKITLSAKAKENRGSYQLRQMFPGGRESRRGIERDAAAW